MIDFVQNSFTLLILFVVLGVLVLLIQIFTRPDRGLYLTFFATGILVTPKLPILRGKLTAVEVIMTLTWLALISHPNRDKKSIPLTSIQTTSLILGGAFISWTIFSFVLNATLYPVTFTDSLIETANFIYGYFMFMTIVFLARNWNRWESCLKGWLGGASVVSIFGVWALAGHAPRWTRDEFSGRICSTLRTAIQVPSFLLPIFVLLVFMIVEKNRKLGERWILTVLLAGVFLTAIGTGSRTALIMLIVSGIGILYVMVRESPYHAFKTDRIAKISFLVFFSTTAYIALALANYDGHYVLGKTPAWQRPVVMMYEWSQGNGELDENREAQLEIVSANINDNLVIGTGPKNYGQLYDVQEIHDTYAGVLFQMGVPGLVLFLLWLWIVVFTGWRASKKIQDPHQRLMIVSMLVGMILLLLYSLTMFGLRQRNIWLLAGLLVAADSFVPRHRLIATPEPR
jgi:hypothetical protein